MELGTLWLRAGPEQNPLLASHEGQRPCPPDGGTLDLYPLRFIPNPIETTTFIRNGIVVTTERRDGTFRGRERSVGDPSANAGRATRLRSGFVGGFTGRVGGVFGCLVVVGVLLLALFAVLVARPTLLQGLSGSSSTPAIEVLNLGSVARFGALPSPPPSLPPPPHPPSLPSLPPPSPPTPPPPPPPPQPPQPPWSPPSPSPPFAALLRTQTFPACARPPPPHAQCTHKCPVLRCPFARAGQVRRPSPHPIVTIPIFGFPNTIHLGKVCVRTRRVRGYSCSIRACSAAALRGCARFFGCLRLTSRQLSHVVIARITQATSTPRRRRCRRRLVSRRVHRNRCARHCPSTHRRRRVLRSLRARGCARSSWAKIP